ncbi:hypothetical protein [Bacillus horti]|uniref:Uncharacterized protein n=1 Tax=Caldalkalibacillus horti TaxID=77523 RepID=A0ABT9W0Z0_9BACI|nr:hypothetical protein [Bacillus horti]MDQ0166933.1 hypothetical protein [Bacillus horti]
MEQVIGVFKRDHAERRIPVLRMEIDYELVNLHDAMIDEDIPKMDICKQRLMELSKEMMLLEAYSIGGQR